MVPTGSGDVSKGLLDFVDVHGLRHGQEGRELGPGSRCFGGSGKGGQAFETF